MLKFEDVMNISDQEMQLICRELPVTTLVRALKKATPELRDKFLRNIRPAFAEMFNEMAAKHADVSDAEAEGDRARILEIIQMVRRK